jgi:Phytoene dehydrogenase and related proteins
MLLERLPKLKAKKYAATEAFRGTFHSDEGYEQMKASYEQAAKGRLPGKTPCEVYCHTLTDDSILAPDLRKKGFQTLTLFGLDAPYRLFVDKNDEMRMRAEKRFLASMNQWLEEPLEDCLALARDGVVASKAKVPSISKSHWACITETSSTMRPRSRSQSERRRPAWGVETEFDNVFLCGSSAQRGGAVSGIPGHNAAMKVLASL